MVTSKRSLRILVTPLNGHGHINACHGLCEELRSRGHEIIFVIDKSFSGRLTRYGFKERILDPPKRDGSDTFDDDEDFWPQFLQENAARYEESPLEQLSGVILEAFTIMADHQNLFVDQYEKAIAEVQPDLIIHDGYIAFPTIVNQPIPWVWLFSAAPHAMLLDPRIPPFYSGLPIDSNKKEWTEFTEKALEALSPLQKRVNEENLRQEGKDLNGRLHGFSDFLNIFMQPEELRYSELTLPENVVAVDCFVRTVPEQTFELPAQLKEKPNSGLVFFSMGSFGCANLSLMKRLVAILAKSKHRFIISKGPLQYDLPGDNLWGEPFLPQTAILPMVDLVVTHGGNNTVTEGFYFGKPMLILPMFCDQFDNAQRIKETGLGNKLDPFRCTEEELLGAIDRLLADRELAERMEQIGKRIRASEDKKKVADLIESKLAA